MTLLGEYRHVIDAKNRLFIPAKFREELGETFYITRKVMEKCLAIYSEAEWQKFSEKIYTLPDSKVGKIKQFIFSKTAQVTADSHGRILICDCRHRRPRTGLERRDMGCQGIRNRSARDGRSFLPAWSLIAYKRGANWNLSYFRTIRCS